LHYIQYGKKEGRQALPSIAGYARQKSPEDKSGQPNSKETPAELIRRSGLFDPEWYSANNPDVSAENALSHYINHGDKEGRDPHPLFDVDWYRGKYLEENASSACAFVDYLSYRGANTRNPHPLFDIKYIENRYGFAFPKETSALEYFCSQREDIDTCPLFDSKLYRYQVENESHRILTEPSLIDYLRRGYKDLLVRPNILFDPKTYIDHNKLELSGPALTHYALYGDRAGLRTHDHFDAGIYNSNRTDAKQTTAIEHFFVSSPRERVISTRYFSAPLPDEAISFVRQIAEHDGEFDVEFYRAAYPDLRGVEPEKHFVEWGRKEGRSGTARHFVQQMGISIREIPLAFYVAEYLNLNADLRSKFKADFLPLFLHYLAHGLFEKRNCGNWQLFIDPDQYPISTSPEPLFVPTTRERREVCVLMHVFYPDLFGELVSYAQNFGSDLGGVHINVVDSVWTPSVHKNIRELTPDAFVMMSPNSGRDIGGFLRLLDHLDIAQYNLFAFMHTKKSPHVAPEKAEYWRRRLLNAFAGNKTIARNAIRRFKDDPSIGLIACADWRENDIGKNAAQFTRILDVLEIDNDHREIEYVSGTMFLIRGEIVQRLHEKLHTTEFESGDNQSLEFNMDGQIAHSIERAIGNLVRQLGYRIEWVSQ
jgi:hypothetical protein